MDDKAEPFDSLAAGISYEDRAAILNQIKSKLKPEETTLGFENSQADLSTSESNKGLSSESIFTRLILFIKSLFMSESIEVVYAEHRITKLAKKIESKFPQILNAQRLTLEQGFYDLLIDLRKIGSFFQAEVLYADEYSNDFLIILGSLIMGEIESKIDKAVNPFSIPFTQDVPNDLRASLLRKMDSILLEVNPQDKSVLYTCVRSMHWLTTFVQLPFDQLIQKFSPSSVGTMSCVVTSAINELDKFAAVLSNARTIEPEVLEALYLFHSQNKLKPGEKLDIESGINAHLEMSGNCIHAIKKFSRNVPIISIGKVAHKTLSWLPLYKESGEDWFVQYKTQWKRIFDRKWSKWLQEKKVFTTKAQVMQYCGVTDYPYFPNRPWKKDGITHAFTKEHSLGFLYAFFTKVYPKHLEALKILMVSGDFVLRDNKTEFTETYSEMNNLAQAVEDLNVKLSPKGLHGQNFAELPLEALRTVQGQMQSQMLIQAVESEVAMIIITFGNACRSFNSIFGGILIAKYNSNYDSISNIASLVGPDNAPIRKHLVSASEAISKAFEILKDIDAIEMTGAKGE